MGVVVQVNSTASTQIRAARVEENRRVIVTDVMSRMMPRQLNDRRISPNYILKVCVMA